MLNIEMALILTCYCWAYADIRRCQQRGAELGRAGSAVEAARRLRLSLTSVGPRGDQP